LREEHKFQVLENKCEGKYLNLREMEIDEPKGGENERAVKDSA
jgi:hypothetical protein